jgi:hypothetical protein
MRVKEVETHLTKVFCCVYAGQVSVVLDPIVCAMLLWDSCPASQHASISAMIRRSEKRSGKLYHHFAFHKRLKILLQGSEPLTGLHNEGVKNTSWRIDCCELS